MILCALGLASRSNDDSPATFELGFEVRWRSSPRALAWARGPECSPSATGATSGPDIEGARDELAAVREAILDLAASGAGSRVVAADTTGSPEPYDTWLGRLVIAAASGPTRVSVRDGRELDISGGPECLRALASFFEVPANAQKGWHCHHEYYDGNTWVAEDSEPMVVSLRA